MNPRGTAAERVLHFRVSLFLRKINMVAEEPERGGHGVEILRDGVTATFVRKFYGGLWWLLRCIYARRRP